MAEERPVEDSGQVADLAESIFDENAVRSGARIEVVRVQSKTEGTKWDYYWMLYSGNGHQVATGVRPQHRLNDLKVTVKNVATYAGTVPFVRVYES